MKFVSLSLSLLVVFQLVCGDGEADKHDGRSRRHSHLRRTAQRAPDVGLSNNDFLTLEYPCVLLVKDFLAEDYSTTFSYFCQLQNSDIGANGGRTMVQLDTITPEFVSKHSIVSGETTWYAEGATISNNRIHVPTNSKVELSTVPPSGRRKLVSTSGDKSVLAVRVEARDSDTSASESKLRREIFGEGGYDAVNLVSQYKACSNNRLRFYPSSNLGVTQGVTTVRIDSTVKNRGEWLVEELVLKQLEKDLNTQNLDQEFDHIILCLPQDTNGGGWIGYAYVNSWLSILNNDWCTTASGLIHEVGHNLAMGHSGEGNSAYADQSGMMGYSYFIDDGPEMCFNGAKSWQMGWYAEKNVVAEPLKSTWTGDLMGVAEYNQATGNDKIIVKVVGDTGVDYYVAFNRKSGCNKGTVEGANQVLVTSRSVGSGHSQSNLVAKLGKGNVFTDNRFNGETMTIRVKDIVYKSNGTAKATVEITSTGAGKSTNNNNNEPKSCWDIGNNYSQCMGNGCSWDGYHNRCF